MNLRFVIVIAIYAAVIAFAPKQPDIARLLYHAQTLDPNIAISISFGALVAAGAGSYIMWRQPNGIMRKRPKRVYHVLHMGLLGVIFASIFDVFFWLSGESTDIVSLILVPSAFVIAESVYMLIHWRINRPPEDY